MDSLPDGVIPATAELAGRVAAALLPDHAAEVAAMSGLDGTDALRLSLAGSLEAYAFAPKPDGDPVFIMGVGPRGLLSGEATVWMLGTPGQPRHPAGVLRTARWGVRRAFAVTGAECLEQHIPEWYETGLRFAERLGFALSRSGLRCRDGSALWRAVLPVERLLSPAFGKERTIWAHL